MTFATDIHNQLLLKKINALEGRMGKLVGLTGVPTASETTTLGSIQNLIDDGEIEFSKDAYINTPLAGGDIGFEAYNWYRQTVATTLLAESAANALKYTGHSLFAANEGANADIPRWENVSGWIEMGAIGTNYDVACPLPINFVRGGMTFIVQFIHKMRTTTAWPAGLEVAAMFYDNTVAQEKIIEGGVFTVSYALGGAAGATALEYKIVGRTDYGDEIESNVLSITDAPATLTTTDYISLSWAGAPGYIDFDIYKKVGGVYYLQFTVANGGTSYRDIGAAPLATVAGYPSISTTRARAYVETQGFAPSGTTWAALDPQLIIRVPSTYNTALTTGRQWLRLRLTGATTDARQLLIDRIGVSTGFGGWARSANDLQAAARNPSTTASTWEQGGIGILPPDFCPSVDADIDAMVGEDKVKIKAGDVDKGDKVFRRGRVAKVTRARTVWCDNMILVTTANGKSLPYSSMHPVLRSESDRKGLAGSKMKKGDPVDTKDGASEIESIEEIGGGFIRDFTLTAPHTYWANDIGSHNTKIGGL